MNQDELPLRDLTVEGYRGIRHLRLPELGRVNLFVGKNNAGKTSLLEAIRIHAEPQPLAALRQLLRQRTEHSVFRSAVLRRREDEISETDLREAARVAESLFFRTQETRSPLEARFTCSGRLGGTTRLFLPWRNGANEAHERPAYFSSDEDPLVAVERAGAVSNLPLKGVLGIFAPGDEEVLLVGAGGFEPGRIASYWSRAAALGHAPMVDEAFRSFMPEARRVFVLAGRDALTPSIAIEVEGEERPALLPELGDGARRVLGIVLAMINTAGGVLLIDEVENGIHHSVQWEVWDGIFSLASELHVQVFATTHSWDAVVGFQYAANRSPDAGMLYRLEREPDGNVYTERYTEADVAIAAEQQIEVR